MEEKDRKEYYEHMLLSMIEPLKKHFSPGKARLELGAETAGYGNRVAGMEGFSRLLWGLVPYWAGGGEDVSLVSIYQQGLLNGTDPESPEYWGDLHTKDQRMVEMAAVSYGLLLVPDKLWDPLPEKGKQHLAVWLNQINQYALAENNWQYFNVLTNLALKCVGMPWNQERMEEAMAKYESFYLGNGWYSDGLRPQKDYYISFAIHYYCLLYAKVMEQEDTKRCQKFRERAKKFAASFLYWFDEEGKALPFGRSQTYRFAQGAFWSMCAMTELDGVPVGVWKGMITRHLDFWMKQPIFDQGGVLTIGYQYPNLNMSEGYNASGSPYWAFKVFAFLALPKEHDFWKTESLPFPELEQTRAIRECDMLIMHKKREVMALTAGQYPALFMTHAAEKYAKFAYSSRFGFSVPRSYLTLGEAAPDSMLAFYLHDMVYVRRKCQKYEVTENAVFSSWSPIEGIEVETILIPEEYGYRRKHRITSRVYCQAYDCGFSYPDCQKETVSRCEGHKAEVRDLWGSSSISSEQGTPIITDCAPNTNLIFPKTRIPAIEYQIVPGVTEIEARVETRFTDQEIRIGKGNCYEIWTEGE